LVQIIAHLLDDQAALDERLFGTFTCNQVQITFAVTLLYIFQAVIFIRQRSERLCQRSELLRLHSSLSCVRLELDTFDTEPMSAKCTSAPSQESLLCSSWPCDL